MAQERDLKLLIVEDNSPGYPSRTQKNVMYADITIAIAINHGSPGEKLTREYCVKHKKPILAINPRIVSPWKAADLLSAKIEQIDGSEIVLNVAGNGVFTMKGEMTQEQCNAYVLEVFQRLTIDRKIRVRSGGQTGFDIAGIVAARKMNWEAEALYPKGFRIRDEEADKTMTRSEIESYIQQWL